jgi:hypothetical protein
MFRVLALVSLCLWLLGMHTALAAPATLPVKPMVAVFPLGGDGDAALRERTAFALRMKLDRSGFFEVVDGPRMNEIVRETGLQVSGQTSVDELKAAAALADAQILIWGELSGAQLTLRIVEGADANPVLVKKEIRQPTDLRFAVEQTLGHLTMAPRFEHPSEVAVQRDPVAEALWAKNPNLVPNGDFSEAGRWTGIYQSEWYEVPQSDAAPAVDKMVMRQTADGERVLSMQLSKRAAENNGLACLSDAIAIEPQTRYRLSFRYRSEGPVLHVFVKGYTRHRNIRGEETDREIYRRQVPLSGGTGGKWVTVVDDLNPQHPQYPVQTLRVDLYAYLVAGAVEFDDVVLKAVGTPTRAAKDAAIKPAATRPAGAQ